MPMTWQPLIWRSAQRPSPSRRLRWKRRRFRLRPGVDELDIDAHAVSAALDAAFEDIADVQFAPDLLHVERLALVGERRVAGDDEGASYP